MKGKRQVSGASGSQKETSQKRKERHKFWLVDIYEACIIGLDLLAHWGASVDIPFFALTIRQTRRQHKLRTVSKWKRDSKKSTALSLHWAGTEWPPHNQHCYSLLLRWVALLPFAKPLRHNPPRPQSRRLVLFTSRRYAGAADFFFSVPATYRLFAHYVDLLAACEENAHRRIWCSTSLTLTMYITV